MPVGRDFQSQWPGGKWIDKDCCLVMICGTWRSKRGFLSLTYRGKGKSHKQEELLWETIKKLPKELITELHYLELPTISASCGLKIYNMHYIRFLLTKTHQHSKEVWINFSTWIYFYLHYWFFINLQMRTEWAFAFLNTAVIIFSLRYSLNIPHQTPSFSPV